MSHRVVIADDEPLAREKLRDLLRAEPEFVLVAEAANGVEAVRLCREHRPEVLILDIEMPRMDGLAAIRELADDPPPCTFLATAHDEHAIEAFEINVLDYLLKPCSRERFRLALEKARRVLEGVPAAEGRSVPLERMLVKANERYVVVDTADIFWVEAAANYVVLHTPTGNHVLRGTLSQLAGQLDGRRFFRSSRSALVSLDAIREILPGKSGGHDLLLCDGSRVRLGRNLRELQERLLPAGCERR